jgi:hypothetical protein
MFPVLEEDILEVAVSGKLGLGVNEVTVRQGIGS